MWKWNDKRLKETQAKPGEWVVISGIGGLGHLAVQYAKAMGLHVCAVDIDDGKLAHAKKLGADVLANAKTGDPVAEVIQATNSGAHGVLITVTSLPAFSSFVGNRRDLAEALTFAAGGKVKADIELQPLSAINSVLQRLKNGDVPSRVVLEFAGA